MSGEREPFPTERSLADAREEQAELRAFVAGPGRIQSYDAASQTADIIPLIRQQVPQPDGSYAMEELPVIPSVPVKFMRSRRWFVAFKLTPGDSVELLGNTSAIGHWRAGDGGVTDPGDLRRQHISHAIALPGLYTRGQALAHAPTPSGDDELVIGSDVSDGTRLAFKSDGSVEITRGNTACIRLDADGTVHLGGVLGDHFVALENLVTNQFVALKTAIAGAATAPSDGGALFKTNILAALTSWPGPVAALKTKAT